MSDLDLYVLGAGASYVHGAPLLDEILPQAFRLRDQESEQRLRVVADFLEHIFATGPNVAGSKTWFPSLVDALSVVDTALDRKENLASGYDEQRLREVRGGLEYAIFRTLEHSLSYASGARRSQATRDLVRKLTPQDSAVISFNYDVIADIALATRYEQSFRLDRSDVEFLAYGSLEEIDYCVDFANIDRRSLSPNAFRLLKLHGSFNWLHSRTTGNLYFGGMQKAAGQILRDDRTGRDTGDLWRFYGTEHRHDLEPVMVTPTHLKDLRNVHLATVWRHAEETIRDAARITFIGYSFPSDDLHVKYLFKRAIATRGRAPDPEIVVVDLSEGSAPSRVEENYKRFFGKKLRYYRHGFERYVDEEI